MTEKEPGGITSKGPPRWVTVLLAFIVLANIAAALWLQLLPGPGDVTPHVLSVDAEGNANILAMQVETGRTYQRLYEQQNTAAEAARMMLSVSAFLTLLVLVRVEINRRLIKAHSPD